MKKFLFLILAGLLILSCTGQNPEEVVVVKKTASSSSSKGYVKFNPGESTRATVIPPSEDVNAVVVTIEDMSGNIILDSIEIQLLDMGQGNYISSSVQLDAGSYNLTKFLVVDADNNILYAAPLEGAPKAELVTDPLPISFTVTNNQTSSVNVQVVEADGSTPEDFGYVTFSFEVMEDIPYPTESIIRYYNDPGVDGIFNTADDVMTSYEVRHYKDALRDQDVIAYNATGTAYGGYLNKTDTSGSWNTSPGPNGIWFDSDDGIGNWSDWSEIEGVEKKYTSPGPDGQWFTSDDILTSFCISEFDPNNDGVIKRINYVPGPDGIFDGADDEISEDWFGAYFTAIYSGEYARWWSWDTYTSYNDPGPNGIWLDADDLIKDYRTHEFNDGTIFFTKEYVYNVGTDNTPNTSDDFLIGIIKVENNY